MGTLSTYIPSQDKEWNLRRSLHLHRRIGLSAPLDTIKDSINSTPSAIVQQIIDAAAALPLAVAPVWAEWTLNDYSPQPGIRNTQIGEQYAEWIGVWTNDIKNNGLRDKMAFFWHNHFVTRIDDYICPSWMYSYHRLLQKHALGNFKDFVREIGLTPAMLVFLNGIQNTRGDVNENYARELYELFTLGLDNGYTQEDITETARALTGWNGLDLDNLCGEVTFIPALFDSGQKTIFGRTGNWGYDDVVDLVFEERGVELSEFICAKLYRHFVNPIEDADVINQLAAVMRQNNFEIQPVLETMFSSEHFFDDAHIGTVIPGHIEYFLSFMNEMGLANDEELNFLVAFSAEDFNQRMFNPTDVSGWSGNREWTNSSTLPYRWEGISNILGYYYQANRNDLSEVVQFAKGLVDGRENDEVFISRSIIDYILPKGYQTELEYAEALEVFKADLPENYFEDGTWNLDWEYAQAQVFFLIVFIVNSPEFQLK